MKKKKRRKDNFIKVGLTFIVKYHVKQTLVTDLMGGRKFSTQASSRNSIISFRFHCFIQSMI